MISLSVMPISMSLNTQVRRVALVKSFVEEDESLAVFNDVAVSVLGAEGSHIQGRSIGADTQVLQSEEQPSRTNRRAASGSGTSRVESSAVRATVIVHSPVPVMLTVPVATPLACAS